jgi:hypothetical protein
VSCVLLAVLSSCRAGVAPNAQRPVPLQTLAAKRPLAGEGALPKRRFRQFSEPSVVPCIPGSEPERQARSELEALDRRIDALPAAGKPVEALEALDRLLSGPCFALAQGEGPSPDPEDGLALRDFWERGGAWWVGHHLEFGAPHGEDKREPVAVSNPSVRKTLTLETDPAHPLAGLLCPVANERCGFETRGFVLRAARAFQLHAQARLLSSLNPSSGALPETMHSCEKRALAEQPERRFESWRSCIKRIDIPTTALPLGQFKLPRSGWFILRGRRGHHAFCDEIRAYDLGTGSAFVAASCSGLALRVGGSVDHVQTDAQRQVRHQTGRLPLEALREAALMILLSAEAQHDVVGVDGAVGYPVPDGVELRLPEAGAFELGTRTISTSSAQTVIAWSYTSAGRAVAGGELTWPEDDNDAAKDHAVRLIQIAEAGFDEGCTRAAVPRQLHLGSGAPSVSALDASPQNLKQMQEQLRVELSALKTARCRD